MLKSGSKRRCGHVQAKPRRSAATSFDATAKVVSATASIVM